MPKNKQIFSLPAAKATLTICYVLAYVLIIGPSFLAMAVKQTASPAATWLWWFDVFSGNFSGARGVVSDFAYWFSAILSVLLNNAVIIIVVTFIWRFFTERRDEMVRLKQALVLRDVMSKTALYNKLDLAHDPETVEKINAAFREVNENWFMYMSDLFSEEDVAKLRERLEEPIA